MSKLECDECGGNARIINGILMCDICEYEMDIPASISTIHVKKVTQNTEKDHRDHTIAALKNELWSEQQATKMVLEVLINLRKAQKAYMADRGNEALGKQVAQTALEADKILALVERK